MTRVLEVPIAQLATTLAPLRGPRTDAASALAPLPERVAANDNGTYEVPGARATRGRGGGRAH